MALKFPDILEHNNPNLPLVDITELKGNSYPLATLAETGSIPSSKRKVGAIIFVSSSQEFYGFYGQTTSSADWGTASNWRLFPTTTGSFTGSFSGSFTGSLFGTASWAINAETASYVPASAVVGLNLNSITSGSITASVDVSSTSFSVVSSSNTLFSVSNAGAASVNPRGLTPGLSISGDTIGTIVLQTTGSSGFSITADSTNGFSIYDINDNNTRFYMNDSGSFGLNTTSVSGYALNVSGSSRFFNDVEISGSLTVVNGITGSLYGTASWAENALTASYVPASAVVGLNLSQISTGSISASVSLDSPIAFSIISGSSTLLSVNTASLTTIKNLTVTDNLVVNGTASFINTENLIVKDPFITLNSGSVSLTDSGLVIEYGGGIGSAWYLSSDTTGTFGRFAVAYDISGNDVSVPADEYAVTAKKASGAPSGDPTWGGAINGFGNIYVNSDNGEIFIYS